MIAAVVVTFNPDEVKYAGLVSRLSGQVDSLVVVDNSDRQNDDAFSHLEGLGLDWSSVSVFRFGGNRGLAAALNQGIEIALNGGADYILLSDQDSMPAPDMVAQLAKAHSLLSSQEIRVGAVGPTFADLYTGVTYPFQANVSGRFFYGHQSTTEGRRYVEALTIITSGTLISRQTLLEVGLMRECFFIDQIDIEWCHRARAKGYKLFGVYGAEMHQHMGESVLAVWFLKWRKESLYSPLRIYYRIRNYVFLVRLDYIDTRWKLRSGWYWLGIVYAHVLFGPQKTKSLKMAFLGLWDGLRGKSGVWSRK